MSLNTEQSMLDKINDCLTQQLSELELLKSMYPKPDEIVLTDQKIVDEIQNFILNMSEYTLNHLDFVVNLFINDIKLEICIDLPSLYPCEEPDIYVRCNQLNRQQEKFLNTELTNYITKNYTGEVCVYTAISWLQDNAEMFLSTSNKLYITDIDEETGTIEEKFVRMWIYSHHIYNKKKREEIVKLAKKIKLTGFCIPGKPGIICIEGPSKECRDWWKDVKGMTWKKIMIKKTEEFEVSEREQEQKFDKFEELQINMSAFSKLMGKLGLTTAFNECFGLDT